MTDPTAIRCWRFTVEDVDGESQNLALDGRSADDTYFLGTAQEAATEADRRADAYEQWPEHGLVGRVTYASHGKVGQ